MIAIIDKKQFLKDIERIVGDDDLVIWSGRPLEIGIVKKHGIKKVTHAYSQKLFKDKDTIQDLMNSQIGGIIILNKDKLSDDVLIQMKKVKQ